MVDGIKQRFIFIKKTLGSKRQFFFALASGFLFGFVLLSLSSMTLFVNTTQFDATSVHALVVVVLSILFGLNIMLLRTRIMNTRDSESANIGYTSFASILGIVFSGCASCGLTVASYVGLGAFATYLPWSGIEVDLLAMILLLYSIWNLSTPVACLIPQKNRKSVKF